MCVIFFAYKTIPEHTLFLLANRDESYQRPSQVVQRWQDIPHIVAGRDLKHGGTWMGVSTKGRIAALTAFRDGHAKKDGYQSRGQIVTDFLDSSTPINRHHQQLQEEIACYRGYNLIYGDLEELHFFSSSTEQHCLLSPGIYGLSNAILDTPWPKVKKGKRWMKDLIASGTPPSHQECFEFMQDNTPAENKDLPNTGVGQEIEKALSPIFIKTPHYGTRCTTVLSVSNSGEIVLRELSYDQLGEPGKLVEEQFFIKL